MDKIMAKGNKDPFKSPIIQVGVVFIFVAAMFIVAYTVKHFLP